MTTQLMIPGLETPVPKAFRGGTHRLFAPEETLERVRPLLPRMGITRIANVTGLDCLGIPVVMVCRPNSRSLAVSQGKGLTLAAAKASGVMESIELYHAEYITLPLILGSYEELRHRHRLVDVTALPSIKNSRFHSHLQILWIEGYDILQGESVWLPYEIVHSSAKAPSPTGSGCFASTSNGLASGNHLLEAILHGICEVIERDSTTLWEASGSAIQQQARIDINTIDDLNCRQVIEKCHQAGVEVAVWETTSDIGVPSFISQICDRTDATFNPLPAFTGMGCHSTREIALLRSLTEAVQCRLTLIAGSRDDMFRNQYKNDLHRERITTYQFKTSDKTPQRHFQQVPTYHGETFDDDIIWVLERLRTVGIERVITVNLTNSEFNLSVVRVVIPGLEGPDEDPEYVPGLRARSLERVHT